jgi:hypothetical protein
MAILIICNIIHFYTVSFLTATKAIRQLDKEFESVAESMAVPILKPFCASQYRSASRLFRFPITIQLAMVFKLTNHGGRTIFESID